MNRYIEPQIVKGSHVASKPNPIVALPIEGAAIYPPAHTFRRVASKGWKGISSKIIFETKFHALDEKQKLIFLDIACFFVNMNRDYVADVLDGDTGITRLTDTKLLTVNAGNELKMLGFFQDMGREIVRRECPDKPIKRSRLWYYKDVDDVLKICEGGKEAKEIEAIVPVDQMPEGTEFNAKALSGMCNLRLLQINNVYLTGDYELLPKSLHWICWHNCPLPSLPSDFNPENVVHLDLQHSRLISVWKGTKVLKNLRVLNLSHCLRLKRTPNFKGLRSLKKLLLEGCSSLVEVHKTLQQILDTLVILDLTNCVKLRNLPCSTEELRSKKLLSIRGWPLDENPGEIETKIEN